jgi:peptide/nickel transport system substrate-binding protein
MTKKIVWLVASCLMVLSLVMASCGPAAEEEEEVEVGEEEVTVTEEEPEEEVVEEEGLLPPEVPKYGGWTYQLGRDPMGFDEGYMIAHGGPVVLTNEALTTGNFAKGPAGTGETDWSTGYGGNLDLMTGALAESWDVPDDETLIFYMRKGVHFYTNPESEACNLVGGREVTAEDVVFELNRVYFELPTSAVYNYYKPEYKPISFTAKDKYTVEIKTVPGQAWAQFRIADAFSVFPRELIEKYGDMNDWRNNCGTGAFILKDYVPGSSFTYTRNPDYWMHDPIHPENQLPYYDGIKYLIMLDNSTKLAAMRTGKIDLMFGISREDTMSIINYNPDILYIKRAGTGMTLTGRCDKPGLPFDDIRVRQALNLAVNKQAILDDYYDGYAEMLGCPYLNTGANKDFFTPLEEQPSEPTIPGSRCSVQELFTYNPEKAKQLLAEAGYPDGFKAEVISLPGNVDYLSIILADYAKVGITLEIKSLESTTFDSMHFRKTFPEMIFYPMSGAIGVCHLLVMFRPEHGEGLSMLEDPKIRDTYNKIQAVLHWDSKEMYRLLKEIGPYILELAPSVWLPAPDNYTLYQPWFQNYRGESESLGWTHIPEFIRYFWVDTAMKKSLGY